MAVIAGSETTTMFHICGRERLAIHDAGTFGRIASRLAHPTEQYPRLVHFLGRKSKDRAVNELYLQRAARDSQYGHATSLRCRNSDRYSEIPLFIEESDPFADLYQFSCFGTCHDPVSHEVHWDTLSKSSTDVIFARLLFIFADVICVFADDFPSLSDVANRLTNWARRSSGSGLPNQIRPHVVIVSSDPGTTISLDAHNYKGSFLDIELCILKTSRSANTRFRPLKDLIQKRSSAAVELRRQHGFLFSAMHWAAFFQQAIAHVAGTATEPFDFVEQSRSLNPVSNDFADHIYNFLQLCTKFKVQYEIMASYIASAIVMDAYPPHMHLFPARLVFKSLYRKHCFKALHRAFNSSADLAEYRCSRIEQNMETFAIGLDISYSSSAQMHSDILQTYSVEIAQLKSSITCLYCLRRKPEHVLGCEHSICDTCVKIFGQAIRGVEGRYFIRACIICKTQGTLVARVKFETEGINILTIDGGGARGVLPLGHLRLFQKTLGESRLQDLFHVAAGTSSGAPSGLKLSSNTKSRTGGLIVLGLFIMGWNVTQCDELFDSTVKPFFKRHTAARLSSLKNIARWWLQDGVCDERELESVLKDTFSPTRRLFDPPTLCPSGTKVFVTATSTSNADPIVLSNFNGQGDLALDSGYTHVRPWTVDDEPLIWQAARATSAAPGLIKPAYIPGVGYCQDGGLRHQNPVSLALWESKRIWPESANVSNLLSFGTGKEYRPASLLSPYIRNIIHDGFLARLIRSWWSTPAIDGEVKWNEITNGLSENDKTRYARFNVVLPGKASLIDTAGMDHLRSLISLQPSIEEMSKRLLTSQLFLVLDGPITLESPGFHKCRGTIRCSGACRSVINDIMRLIPGQLEFVTANDFLSYFDGQDDICSTCHRFGKDIEFYVRHPTDSITLYLRSAGKQKWELSGFPQTMAELERLQHVHAKFGTADHGIPGALLCPACQVHTPSRVGRKRKLTNDGVPKRARFRNGRQ